MASGAERKETIEEETEMETRCIICVVLKQTETSLKCGSELTWNWPPGWYQMTDRKWNWVFYKTEPQTTEFIDFLELHGA